jgi:hypothetical protein
VYPLVYIYVCMLYVWLSLSFVCLSLTFFPSSPFLSRYISLFRSLVCLVLPLQNRPTFLNSEVLKMLPGRLQQSMEAVSPTMKGASAAAPTAGRIRMMMDDLAHNPRAAAAFEDSVSGAIHDSADFMRFREKRGQGVYDGASQYARAFGNRDYQTTPAMQGMESRREEPQRPPSRGLFVPGGNRIREPSRQRMGRSYRFAGQGEGERQGNGMEMNTAMGSQRSGNGVGIASRTKFGGRLPSGIMNARAARARRRMELNGRLTARQQFEQQQQQHQQQQQMPEQMQQQAASPYDPRSEGMAPPPNDLPYASAPPSFPGQQMAMQQQPRQMPMGLPQPPTRPQFGASPALGMGMREDSRMPMAFSLAETTATVKAHNTASVGAGAGARVHARDASKMPILSLPVNSHVPVVSMQAAASERRQRARAHHSRSSIAERLSQHQSSRSAQQAESSQMPADFAMAETAASASASAIHNPDLEGSIHSPHLSPAVRSISNEREAGFPQPPPMEDAPSMDDQQQNTDGNSHIESYSPPSPGF